MTGMGNAKRQSSPGPGAIMLGKLGMFGPMADECRGECKGNVVYGGGILVVCDKSGRIS